MCNTNNYKELTFALLLDKYDKILVPMIQRDYAQGRTDKKAQEVRTNLLNDIFEKESVHFDLIFGSCETRKENDGEKRCFIPVDGQQRLTTLFLLYLYAKKVKGLCDNLNLSKFSYDTRRAASDFCISVTANEWSVSNDVKVSEAIKDSTWFMNYWENDPTVEGMLNMLDAIDDKEKGNVFPNLDKVKFYFFDLESHGLNENLYLKMNSRGKPLTAFENLKAKIEKVLPDDIQIDEKYFPEKADSLKNFKEKWKFFMDRKWTDTFWDEKNPDRTDTNITAFIVRFLSGYWGAFGNKDDENEKTQLKEINNENNNGGVYKKNYAEFIPFEPIKKILETESHFAFQMLGYALTVISDSAKIAPYWDANDYPKKSEERCEYKNIAAVFAYVLFDGNTNKHAMRFAWNMAENTINGYDSFISYCELVGEIFKYHKENEDDIYQILSTKELKKTLAQLTEEIAKAKQIIKGGDEWESKIINAEKYSFFKGAIRFLFTKENVGDDWGNFDTKWNNATKYFDENGVKDKTPYKTNALLMKSLLANCDNFGGKIWWHFEFSNDKVRWKRILIADHWKRAVDTIMSKEVTTETTDDYVNNAKDVFIKNIIDDGLMDYVCDKMSGAWLRNNTYTYHGYQAIWVSGYPAGQIVLNLILAQLKCDKIIDYRDINRIENCRYYKCVNKNVDFKYKFNGKDYFFNWKGNPSPTELDVYLAEENWNDYKKRPSYEEGKTDKDNHYCFKVTDDMKDDTSPFINELERLIREAENDQQCEKPE